MDKTLLPSLSRPPTPPRGTTGRIFYRTSVERAMQFSRQPPVGPRGDWISTPFCRVRPGVSRLLQHRGADVHCRASSIAPCRVLLPGPNPSSRPQPGTLRLLVGEDACLPPLSISTAILVNPSDRTPHLLEQLQSLFDNQKNVPSLLNPATHTFKMSQWADNVRAQPPPLPVDALPTPSLFLRDCLASNRTVRCSTLFFCL